MDEDINPIFPLEEVTDTRGAFTTALIAEKLREGAMSRDRLIAQVRSLARAGYIQPFGVDATDARRPYLYRSTQVLVAAVVIRLIDHGFNDRMVLHRAALALNAWDESLFGKRPHLRLFPERDARSPAEYLIDQFLTGIDGWCLEIGSFRHPDHDRAENHVRLRNGVVRTPAGGFVGTEYPAAAGFQIRMMSIVDLAPILEHLFGAMRRKQSVN